jgi:hypothetical protein
MHEGLALCHQFRDHAKPYGKAIQDSSTLLPAEGVRQNLRVATDVVEEGATLSGAW